MKTTFVLATLCGVLALDCTGAAVPGDEGNDASQPSLESAAPKDTTPYGMIIARNVFRLNPPPPPAPPAANENPAAAAGGLKLTGLFRSTGSPLRALFVNVPSNPTNTVYYNLAEGERDGVLELLKINEAEESAEVVHAGNRVTVLLKDSKPASTGGAAAGGPPPAGVTPGAATPVRTGAAVTATPGPTATPAAANRSAVIGGNGARGGNGVVVSGGVPAMPMVGAPGVVPVDVGAGGAIPGRTVRATPQTPQYQPTPEQVGAVMQYVQTHGGPPLPGGITPINPEPQPGQNTGAPQTPSIPQFPRR